METLLKKKFAVLLREGMLTLRSQQEGKVLFNTYCAVCHGVDGKGEGYIKYAYPVPVPDISRADLAARKDGFFFMKITNGGAMMPAYGYAISKLERWQIITHLRTLQGK